MCDGNCIEFGSLVTLHFSVALNDGHVVDSNFEGAPASFNVGDGNMLPGFESQLLGLCKGDAVEVVLGPDQAFGPVNQENVHRLPRSRFNQFLDDEYEELQVGTVVSFKDPGGFDLPGVVKEKSTTAVVVDFNHPLAGKDIVFKARIVEVIPPGTDSVEIKL
jgi:FKBP-type peptidyl-prolyl cis-trans isomerase SlpA